MSAQDEYERMRRHGLSHGAALEAVSSGDPFRCWCGSETPCDGGAQKHVGCPIDLGIGLPLRLHKGDLRAVPGVEQTP